MLTSFCHLANHFLVPVFLSLFIVQKVKWKTENSFNCITTRDRSIRPANSTLIEAKNSFTWVTSKYWAFLIDQPLPARPFINENSKRNSNAKATPRLTRSFICKVHHTFCSTQKIFSIFHPNPPRLLVILSSLLLLRPIAWRYGRQLSACVCVH